ncbi:MAG: 16S rRNA (cytosine(1402)-N(4))-methyltransferase RsmH [Candidatus Omnitrophica bacterium]|nr:16S rRNA (cytosine(1402)-N(4))-methyltransferase RsmH [Candidatus Omnitrophota bacterium]
MTVTVQHIPVMAREVEGLLNLGAGSVYVDCTLGLGGHASLAAGIIGAKGRIVGIDQDADAIAHAHRRLSGFVGQLDIVKSNFGDIDVVLDRLGIMEVDGVLLDLGVSSLQLDDASRGFSYREEALLDMRMDKDAQFSATELVNSLPEEELADLIWRLGEERFSRRIARNIVAARSARAIKTTKELSDLVLRSLPRGYQRGALHPATRTFQALRMAVNRELEVLKKALDTAPRYLKIGGRLVVIAFHSLEDRIVKEKFKELARSGSAKILTKKPLRPGDEEVIGNPRSRSARLRALERIV